MDMDKKKKQEMNGDALEREKIYLKYIGFFRNGCHKPTNFQFDFGLTWNRCSGVN